LNQPSPQTIVLIGDVHDETQRLARTLDLLRGRRPDLVLLAGDVGEDPPWHRALRRTRRAGHDESIRRVIAHVRSACDCPVVFVPGNHDLHDPPEDVEGVNADGRVVSAGGLRIAGFGGAGPTAFGFPYEWTEDEAEAALDRSFADAGAVDVFLAHSPPCETRLDRTARGALVGSLAVRRWIARMRPKLFVCGHIHEAWGAEWLDDVACVNAGALGEPYGRDLAWIVDWRDGPVRIRSLDRDENGRPDERVWGPS
jgi:Icc-related predicted phosphoesterase